MGQELVLTKLMEKVQQDEAKIALYLMLIKLLPNPPGRHIEDQAVS